MYEKQECVFTDGGKESYRLVVWEELVNTLETESCSMATVKAYNGMKYFSTLADTVTTVIDGSFGDFVGKCRKDEETRDVGEVVAIESLSQFLSCLQIKSIRNE